MDVLADGITRLFTGETPDARQKQAAAAAVLRRLAVVAGGPGTGKTTTVARIVALLEEQALAAGAAPPLVALAAPTGKAAARLAEAVHGEAARLNVDPAIRARLLELEASTLHRLLGWKPGTHSRFRHDRGNRLPYDVVIVDETSMVSLSLMARLTEAVRREARLILVGDPGQLTSIEAGAVLGDIVGPAAASPRLSPRCAPPWRRRPARPSRARRRRRTCRSATASSCSAPSTASAEGSSDSPTPSTPATPTPPSARSPTRASPGSTPTSAIPPRSTSCRRSATAPSRTGLAVIDAARDGDAARAIRELGAFRVLCAHRRGPHGVATWMPRIETWLAGELPGFAAEPWYVGRPLLVTENDHAIRLYNGDTGVVVTSPTGRPTAAFERQGEIVYFSPTRLAAVETVYAMTIHKSQGSQFATAAVLLPDPASPILTRELLYTAVTRAQDASDPRRHRGVDPRRRRPPDRPSVGAAPAAVGLTTAEMIEGIPGTPFEDEVVIRRLPLGERRDGLRDHRRRPRRRRDRARRDDRPPRGARAGPHQRPVAGRPPLRAAGQGRDRRAARAQRARPRCSPT